MLRYYAERISYFTERIHAEQEIIQQLKQSDVWEEEKRRWLIREAFERIRDFTKAKNELEAIYKTLQKGDKECTT
jgi:hypothetical protein